MAPLAHGSVSMFRKHCAHFVRLCAFALELGYDLDLAILLDDDVVASFAATQATGRADALSSLRALATLHGYAPAPTPLGYTRRPSALPYSAGELEALVNHAAHLSTANRRLTLSLIVHLGAGAGVVRSSLCEVTANDLHHHETGLFVRTTLGCRYVLESSRASLQALAQQRPEGLLLGAADPSNVVSRAAEWTRGRKGVPQLSVDRLRATYLERLLVVSLPVVEALASIQVKDLRPMKRLDSAVISCQQTTEVEH
jgi:integrase